MTKRQEPSSIQEFIARLLSPQRQEELDPLRVIALLPIEPYHQVADIGCGPGYFAIPLAKHLIYGKLYALDIEEEMLEALRARVAAVRLGNIEVAKCNKTQFPVTAGSLDGVLLAFVVHQNEDRVVFLKAVAALLKPRGWCAVLEWYRKETDEGPPLEMRIEPQELEGLAKDVGLRFQRWRDLNGRQYMALLRN